MFSSSPRSFHDELVSNTHVKTANGPEDVRGHVNPLCNMHPLQSHFFWSDKLWNTGKMQWDPRRPIHFLRW